MKDPYQALVIGKNQEGQEKLRGFSAATNIVPVSREQLCKMVHISATSTDEQLSVALSTIGVQLYLPVVPRPAFRANTPRIKLKP